MNAAEVLETRGLRPSVVGTVTDSARLRQQPKGAVVLVPAGHPETESEKFLRRLRTAGALLKPAPQDQRPTETCAVCGQAITPHEAQTALELVGHALCVRDGLAAIP